MNRIKTLSLPLISAMFASAGLPANAQVALQLSSQATYRQNQGSKTMNFNGGKFDINFTDGDVVTAPGCEDVVFVPPGAGAGPCSPGSTGFLTAGSINGVTPAMPYITVTAINPALVVAPRYPQLVQLTAAPASGLPRPSGGFVDNSATLYYDLTTPGGIREYILTQYDSSRSYAKGQQEKFKNQIVPGVYHYSFPRLFNPDLPASIAATIYPMVEGFAKRNNVEQGFKYTSVNGSKFNKNGFMELSYIRPNLIQWNPLPPSVVFPLVDSLYFSIRVIKNPNNPKSPVVYVDKYSDKQQAIFPSFTNDGEPRVLLASPLVSQFITPPVMAGGTKGVIEVQVERNFQTGGVTYDFSTRRFQIPVVVVNRYSEYQKIIMNKSLSNSDILKDTDRDGYNNLNEWILGSDATDAGSIPEAPVAEDVPALRDPDTDRNIRRQYFGFTIDQKLGTKPGVVYTLQRSTNNGKTWKKFTSDANWSVRKVSLAPGVGSLKANSPRRVEIRVESKVMRGGLQVEPPGTQNHLYRVKITLAK